MIRTEQIESLLVDIKENRNIEKVLLSFNNHNSGIMSDLPYEAKNQFFDFIFMYRNNKKYIKDSDLDDIHKKIITISNKLDFITLNHLDDPKNEIRQLFDYIKNLPNINMLEFKPIGESFSQKKKKTNPQYIDRGILLYPGNMKTTSNGQGFSISEQMSQEDMFYYALYWDKIMISSSVLNVDLPCDMEFIRQGVLEKLYSLQYQEESPYRSGGRIEDFASHELWVFGDVAKRKLEAYGEDWTICHLNGEPEYMPEHSKEANTIRLRISDVLPSPQVTSESDVEKLLNFKLDRASELDALHDSMDNLIKRVYEEDLHALKEKEIKRFENAVNELDRTLIERFKIIQKSDWEVALNLDPVDIVEKTTAIGAAIYADHTLSPYPIFTGITGLLSMLSFSKKYGMTFNRYARNDIKLEYISAAKSKKIIP